MSLSFAPVRVLIVEDNAFTRSLIAEVLFTIGFQRGNIFEAEDGLSALKLLSSERVNLVITDWRMEPMDGLTFVRKLRDEAKSPDPFVPVIFCSAYTDQRLIENARDIGINEVIAKPININNIESRIRVIFEQPRPFVQANAYFGPDRRRRTEERTGDADRRAKKRYHIKTVDVPDS
jgi:CheY-like chemotaxis protein